MKCLGHSNEFQHFDPGVAEAAAYDLGIKMRDDDTPPGSRSEPRLYLYVSVGDLGTIYYARSRTYLRDGFPSSKADRERLRADVIGRLSDDVNALANNNLNSSEKDPIFV